MNIQLRDLQKDICDFFKQPFPKKSVRLKVCEKMYEDLMDHPFQDATGEEIVATVFFEDTTDPFFYDLIDRKSLKYSLEEEIEWELEISRGNTCLTFKDWLRDKIKLRAVAPDWPMFDQ